MKHKLKKNSLLATFLMLQLFFKSDAQPHVRPNTVNPHSGIGSKSVKPMIATDGQKVEFSVKPPQQNMNVGIIGYKYDESVPQRSLPQGRGRVEIYKSCQAITKTNHLDNLETYSFIIPNDARSGEYFIALFPNSMDCTKIKDSLSKINWNGTGSLYIVPSYIVSKVESIEITGNGENPADSPSEIAFLFSSLSSSSEGSRSLVEPFSGSYPSTGNEKSNYITTPDRKIIKPDLPLFAGRESFLNSIECNEEAEAYPTGIVENAKTTCESDASLFTNSFQVAINGVEFDESPSTAIGDLIGIAVGAAKCYTEGLGCVLNANENIELGTTLAKTVNKALRDDDDDFGKISNTYGFNNDWEVGYPEQQMKLAEGDADCGPVKTLIKNYRVGGPRILNSNASIKKIKIIDGYDGSDEPNEVFINTNGLMYVNGTDRFPAGKRFPANNSYYSLKTNESKNFNNNEIVIFQNNFSSQSALESPLIYLEIGIWEYDSDDQNDLMGIFSQTIFLADFLSESTGITGQNSDGQFTRTVKKQFKTIVNGYDNYSDFRAKGYPNKAAYANAKPQAQKGRVEITYEVEVTWLMSLKRTFP